MDLRVFSIDPESKIVKRGEEAIYGLFISAIIQAVVFGVINFFFVMVIEALIRVSVGEVSIFMMIGYALFIAGQMIFYSIDYFSYTYAVIKPYIVKEGNTFRIIYNRNSGIDSSKVQQGVRIAQGDSVVDKALGATLLVNGVIDINDDFKELKEEFLDKDTLHLINEILQGNRSNEYSIKIYENVAYIKETNKCLYFRGDYLINGKLKQKKFRLKKVYMNYNKLKEV